jgi:hypothetical protein
MLELYHVWRANRPVAFGDFFAIIFETTLRAVVVGRTAFGADDAAAVH